MKEPSCAVASDDNLLDEDNEIKLSVLVKNSPEFFDTLTESPKQALIRSGVLERQKTWQQIFTYSSSLAFQFFYNFLSKEKQEKLSSQMLLPDYYDSIFSISFDYPTEKKYLWELFIKIHTKEVFSEILAREDYALFQKFSVIRVLPAEVVNNIAFFWEHVPWSKQLALAARYAYLSKFYLRTLQTQLAQATADISSMVGETEDGYEDEQSEGVPVKIEMAKMICELAAACDPSSQAQLLLARIAVHPEACTTDFIQRLFYLAQYGAQGRLFKVLREQYPELDPYRQLSLDDKIAQLGIALAEGHKEAAEFIWEFLAVSEKEVVLTKKLSYLLSCAMLSENVTEMLLFLRTIYKNDRKVLAATYEDDYAVWRKAAAHGQANLILDYLYKTLMPSDPVEQQNFIKHLGAIKTYLSTEVLVGLSWFSDILEEKILVTKTTVIASSYTLFSATPIAEDKSETPGILLDKSS